ncbi:MAG: calcium/sodium antiporter [Candidatus Diapherotrites archaeon]|nr:calcium/sodium antiporter [Candidatus Diapherotrites archaeon]
MDWALQANELCRQTIWTKIKLGERLNIGTEIIFAMELITELFMFGLATFALVVSSKWVVDSSKNLAAIFKLSEFTIGFIFLALATSLPELAVSIIASTENAGEIVVGNVLGSNIANILLVLGISALIADIKLKDNELLSNADILLFITMIPLVLLWNGSVGPVSGAILVILFVFYLFVVSKMPADIQIEKIEQPKYKFFAPIVFVVGIGILLISANSMVASAVNIAELANISQTVIGLTIVALGTSVAELIVNIRAMMRRSYGLALGNIFGSCVINLTLVLGAGGIINRIFFNYDIAGPATIFAVGSVVFLTFLLNKYRKIGRRHGLLLLGSYVVFIAVESGITVFGVPTGL